MAEETSAGDQKVVADWSCRFNTISREDRSVDYEAAKKITRDKQELARALEEAIEDNKRFLKKYHEGEIHCPSDVISLLVLCRHYRQESLRYQYHGKCFTEYIVQLHSTSLASHDPASLPRLPDEIMWHVKVEQG
ncbi:hypothetical protein C8Q73DRAFT_796387 [Cubamyces lactineus]|nr:hypothetical protein C8Q73DRAFT_796387 [Cubamyces lactineus]